ncbi:hypothetical protein T484DRAFT_2202493 [Baffinella frigidus]|nr:hypothetical protein T484DRAFT_2202493 [Cryptophyta sp. CCMP2293]
MSPLSGVSPGPRFMFVKLLLMAACAHAFMPPALSPMLNRVGFGGGSPRFSRVLGLCAQHTPSQDYFKGKDAAANKVWSAGFKDAAANKALSKVLSSRGRAPGELEQSRFSQGEGAWGSSRGEGLGVDYQRPARGGAGGMNSELSQYSGGGGKP